MEQVKCFIPETLEEALRIRKETGATVLAGGSDLMVANSMGAGVTPAFKCRCGPRRSAPRPQ